MKILFVNLHFEISEGLPSFCSNRYNYKSTEYVPLSSLTLHQLSAITPSKYDVYILDALYDVKYTDEYDIVGISAVTPSALRAYEIAKGFRQLGVTVVLGGFHASALPEEAIQHADSVVIGEAENSWPNLLEDFEKKRLKPFYRNNVPVDLRSIPPPDREGFDDNTIIVPIQITRGCPNGCNFCSISNMEFKSIFRTRPIDQVIEEIRSIKQKYLFFCDACLTINTEYAKKLFREIKPLNKKLLMLTGNVNTLIQDDELLKLASEAGCVNWLIGFESISQESLREIGKKTNKIENYKILVNKIHDYGMSLVGEFVFGFDHDYLDIFEKTEKMIESIEIDVPGFNILTPYPGTPLFNKLDKQGRILTKDWSKYSVNNVVFQPKNMTPEELLKGINELSQKYSYALKTLRNWIKLK